MNYLLSNRKILIIFAFQPVKNQQYEKISLYTSSSYYSGIYFL